MFNLLLFISLVLHIQTKSADKKPLCFFPEYFTTTIQPLQRSLDIDRYMGKWYEIVRGPLIFEKGCVCSEA